MKLRIGPEAAEALKRAREYCGLSGAEVLRRAARRWERLGRPTLDAIEPGTTHRGTILTVDAVPGLDDAGHRKLLAWYLADNRPRPPAYRFTPPLTEGKDYTVEA